MNQNTDERQNVTLSFDVKNFIQLLQKNNSTTSSRKKRSSVDMDKLSIILSASQPQSSLTDKENTNPLSNGSIQDTDDCLILIKEIEKSGLKADQQLKLCKLQVCINGLKKSKLLAQAKLKTMQNQFEEEKKGTDQILKALMKMDEQEKQLWKKYEQINIKYSEAMLKVQTLEEINEKLNLDIENFENDQQFMKKLVLVANQSYEKLQKKCRRLQTQLRHNDDFKERKSSRQILTRSTKTKKTSYSPSISQHSNLSPRKNEFEENYRRLVLRTLKNKYR